MKKVLLSFAVALSLVAQAQQFEVVQLEMVSNGTSMATFHPRFMPDGNLLVTAENYDGLGIIDVKSGNYSLLTEMAGAGYYPVISEDGKTILTRCMNKENFTQDIYALDLKTATLTPIVKGISHVNQMSFVNGKVKLAVDGKAINKTVFNQVEAKSITSGSKNTDVLVVEEDLKIVVYSNGQRKVLDPLAGQLDGWDPQYTWTSLSPDRTKILFGCADYAYVCDLKGDNLVKVGFLRAAQWRGNNHVVGMVDADDGYYYTKSDIVIVSVDGTQMQQLTPSSNEIKMFPSVSADGSKIAYHTQDGKVYIMTIKEK